MFFEIIGRAALPDCVDRDDVEDAITAALGSDGEVTGAGTGDGGWHLDVEVHAAGDPALSAATIAGTLCRMDLGWVAVRHESWTDAVPAAQIRGAVEERAVP
ncbi:hypothetical protein ACFQZ4_50980 [Catellatospora coxensis]|uniref:Uncharacterized protein n=1 Tax=Catellatospora coxensis TaxID=310354 RepID=A0A8J3KTW4_9ACTN|nr:hypothetical protein [Catellatospora coxensis]GIG05024.1 hypothetical protein Cco03nite_17240 [Catellatospora coxensis]